HGHARPGRRRLRRPGAVPGRRPDRGRTARSHGAVGCRPDDRPGARRRPVMIALAWHTARARSTSLAGSFIAVALGVALLAVMALILASTLGTASHPRWFTKPDVVVAGDNSVSITTGSGDDRETSAVTTGEARAVPAALAGRLAGLGATIVADYAGHATAPGVPGNTVHPWSAAALHGYAWVSGGPPHPAGQLALTAPARLRPGNTGVVQTAAGPRRFTVSGVIRTTAPAAMYASNAVAAGMAGGRINALALTARPGESPRALTAQVRAAAQGQPVRVLTGDQRRAAEPNPDADLFAVAVALLGVTSGLAGFVAIFVVAGTFAYAVAARRRELGLLRTVGATPRQARRLGRGGAAGAGVAAALAGGALAIVSAGPFARWLARAGFAPHDFTAHFILWPLAAASGAGLLIALAGAFVAARRAGRVRPAEALREAAVDHGTMPLTRWLAGLAALGGSVPLFGVLAAAHSVDQAALILPNTMLLVAGFALLAPPAGGWAARGPGGGGGGAGGAARPHRHARGPPYRGDRRSGPGDRRDRRFAHRRHRHADRHPAIRRADPDQRPRHDHPGRELGRAGRRHGRRRPGGAGRHGRGARHGHDGLRALGR